MLNFLATYALKITPQNEIPLNAIIVIKMTILLYFSLLEIVLKAKMFILHLISINNTVKIK